MLYQFRKELIETLLKKHEVVLSMPFAGHEEDFQAMGCKCINTKIDRRGINPLKDLHLIKFYNIPSNTYKTHPILTSNLNIKDLTTEEILIFPRYLESAQSKHVSDGLILQRSL